MLSAFVTTRRPRRAASARATSVVVDPPLSPTEAASAGTSSTAACGDRALGVVVLAAAVAHRQLVQHPGGHRAAVRAGEQLLLLEQVQVAAHRRLGHAELAGEAGHADRTVLVQPLQDQPEPVLLTHGVHDTRIAVSISSTSPRRLHALATVLSGARTVVRALTVSESPCKAEQT